MEKMDHKHEQIGNFSRKVKIMKNNQIEMQEVKTSNRDEDCL